MSRTGHKLLVATTATAWLALFAGAIPPVYQLTKGHAMTAAEPSVKVVTKPAATNAPAQQTRPVATSRQVASGREWLALALLETGNNSLAHGNAGEVGAHQILPSVWRQAAKIPISQATNQTTELAVAKIIQGKRVATFEQRMGRKPTPGEFSLLWHCPAHVLRPNKEEMDYAERFCNIYKK